MLAKLLDKKEIQKRNLSRITIKSTYFLNMISHVNVAVLTKAHARLFIGSFFIIMFHTNQTIGFTPDVILLSLSLWDKQNHQCFKWQTTRKFNW